jgi:predicted CopG family antitoxin
MSRRTKVLVSDETYERLHSCKISRGESMDMLINRLLNKYEGVMYDE